MAADTLPKPSFSHGRKWGIALNVLVRTALVLAVVVMVNYLSGRYFERFFLSSQTNIKLSPRTLSILKTLTNRVDVTLYYDKDDPFYSTVTSLLNEYQLANPLIHIEAVDPVRDPGRAIEVLTKYAQYNLPPTNRNMVIFDYEKRVEVAFGNMLVDYARELVAGESNLVMNVKPIAFLGEQWFTADLMALSDPKPMSACFLQGHGEHAPDDPGQLLGYAKFASILRQNYIRVDALSLRDTNAVPEGCNMLIIAGPTNAIPDAEIAKIEQYLTQGGHLLALFSPLAHGPTGLEKILADWNVAVGAGVVSDTNNSMAGSDVIVGDTAKGTPLALSKHPLMAPMAGLRLHLILPRPVGAREEGTSPADAPHVEALFYTGPQAVFSGNPLGRPRSYPLAVAVEKGAVQNVLTGRGATRIVAVGDSIFLGNRQIDSAANRDFAACAVNWLAGRSQLLQGPGPRRITEFRLIITRAQMHKVEGILLGGLPGGVLLFGGLVWLRRRK